MGLCTVSRTYRTKTGTGMKDASSVATVKCLSWITRLLARTTSCIVLTATTTTSRPGVTDVVDSSEQVSLFRAGQSLQSRSVSSEQVSLFRAGQSLQSRSVPRRFTEGP